MKGVLGVNRRLFYGVSMAQNAILRVLLPDESMTWHIMSDRPPASLPKPVGYPPHFRGLKAVRRSAEIDVLKS